MLRLRFQACCAIQAKLTDWPVRAVIVRERGVCNRETPRSLTVAARTGQYQFTSAAFDDPPIRWGHFLDFHVPTFVKIIPEGGYDGKIKMRAACGCRAGQAASQQATRSPGVRPCQNVKPRRIARLGRAVRGADPGRGRFELRTHFPRRGPQSPRTLRRLVRRPSVVVSRPERLHSAPGLVSSRPAAAACAASAGPGCAGYSVGSSCCPGARPALTPWSVSWRHRTVNRQAWAENWGVSCTRRWTLCSIRWPVLWPIVLIAFFLLGAYWPPMGW